MIYVQCTSLLFVPGVGLLPLPHFGEEWHQIFPLFCMHVMFQKKGKKKKKELMGWEEVDRIVGRVGLIGLRLLK